MNYSESIVKGKWPRKEVYRGGREERREKYRIELQNETRG